MKKILSLFLSAMLATTLVPAAAFADTAVAYTAWSDWSTTAPIASNTVEVEQQVQYRYRDKSTTKSTATSLSGWTRDGTTTYTYGAWSGNKTTTTKPTAGDTLKIVGSKVTKYNYYHWHSKYNGIMNQDSVKVNNTSVKHTYSTSSPLTGPKKFFADKGGKANQEYGPGGTCAWKPAKAYWWLASTTTTYTYQTRTKTANYGYYKWGSWSGWSATKATTSTTRSVETRTAFRYRTALKSAASGKGSLSSGIQQIAAGFNHSAVVCKDGSLWTWGDNTYGQLGIGSTTSKSVPTYVMSDVKKVALGDYYSAAIKKDGSLWTWGQNKSADGNGVVHYQLGTGSQYEAASSPMKILNSGVTDVALGGGHGAAVQNGALYTWGKNNCGQGGDGTRTAIAKPKQVITSGVSAVSVGDQYTAALKSNGTVWTVGRNASYQLGNGGKDDTTGFAQVVSSNASAVSAGHWHLAVLKKDKTLWLCGDNNNGRIGNGTIPTSDNDANRNIKTLKSVLDDVSALSMGRNHSTAIKQDGSLWTWGLGSKGQRGDGTLSENCARPTKVMDGIAQVAAGGVHNLAVRKDGTLVAWGNNSYGQLGDGTKTNRSSAQVIVQSAEAANRSRVSIDSGALSLSSNRYEYNGKKHVPLATLHLGGQALANKTSKSNSYVNVSYSSDAKKVGTHKVTLSGKGYYKGTVTKTFTVVPSKPKVKNVKALASASGTGVVAVKWSKSKSAGGYEIALSTSKKFTKETTKTRSLKASSKLGKKRSCKGAGLKRNKKYYVKIRSYKKVGGKYYYSAWSKAKKVRTRG